MLWVILAIIIVLLLAFVAIYNGLMQSKLKVENAWSQINVQLQRRFDLIPNLVETVKGYMAHETDTLTKITELRTAWAGSQTVQEKSELNNQLSGALKTILAVSESYPDLKANTNFASMQEELRNTENKISYARQFYNDSVTMYNTKLRTIPSNIIAGMLHLQDQPLFTVESEEAAKNVKVDFNK
jgi:LemA protein